MATANDIVNRAAIEIGRLQEGEGFPAEEAAGALDKLNDFIQELALCSQLQSPYPILALTDVMPFPASYNRGFALILARELAGKYGVQMAPERLMQAEDAERRIKSNLLFDVMEADLDIKSELLPSQVGLNNYNYEV